jgi:hypothetical protein
VQNVSRDDWVVGGLALLLAIDLLFFPWFDLSGTVFGVSISVSSTATGDPDGWLGILAVLTTLALVADLAIERLSPGTALPNIGGSRTQTRVVLAGIATLFLVLKFLFHINHFSDLGFGFWLAVVLDAGLVFSALRISQGQSVVPTS